MKLVVQPRYCRAGNVNIIWKMKESVLSLCQNKSAINKGNSVLSLIMEYKNCRFLQVRGVEWALIRLDCVLLQNLYFATCPT